LGQNIRKSFATAETVAEKEGEPSEAQTPQGAGNNEAQTQSDKRGKFGGAVCRDELGHKCEKEQSYLWIENVRKQALSVHSPKAR